MPTTRKAKKQNVQRKGLTRKRLGRDALVKLLNGDFQEMMMSRRDPAKHLFFDSIKWWKSRYDIFSKNDISVKKSSAIAYDPTCDLSILNELPECKYVPSKTLPSAYLMNFFEQLSTITDYDAIRNKCNDMTNYALPSTLKSLDNWKHSKDPNALNIMILGAGPVGLYTSLLLNHLYPVIDIKEEFIKEFSFRKINILLVDNRVFKEGIKMPYSRSTQFGFNILEIQPFLRQIFCWKNMMIGGTRAFDNIHVLENMLYTVAYKNQIPMFFTKRFDEYDALKSFIMKENINVLFDCTGGRTSIPVSYPVKWNKYSLESKIGKVILNPATKYYEYYEDGVPYSNSVLRLQIFNKNNREMITGNHFAYPMIKEDMELLSAYNGKCFRTKDYIKLISHIKEDKVRNLFPHLLEISETKREWVHYVKPVIFRTIARHSPFAATNIGKSCVLIRLGDSLGATEYGIMFGMKHSIEFSKHICSLLPIFA